MTFIQVVCEDMKYVRLMKSGEFALTDANLKVDYQIKNEQLRVAILSGIMSSRQSVIKSFRQGGVLQKLFKFENKVKCF
jgi:uncharacterized protein YajQ (UPF0234 family)